MKVVYLLTGNPGKIAAANAIFNKHSIAVKPLDLEIDEIQASSSAEIARKAALQAFQDTGKPLIREDHSFYIDDLGMPGPFMTFIDKTIPVETLLRILSVLPSRNGHFELAATYVDEAGNAHDFSFQVPIILAEQAKGDESMRWERIMRFPDETRTFAEYTEADRLQHWSQNYENIALLINNS